jgi:aminomethyltransferase
MTDHDSSRDTLAQTPLHALHLELGGKMVPFAGYEMPLQYPTGIMKEHNHTRDSAGLFDVSHMGQVKLIGPEAAAALETLVPVDVIDLPTGHQRYALFTNDSGCILDDLMIFNAGDHLFLVINAACKDQDVAHMRTHLASRCELVELEDRALLALQGPKAGEVMARLSREASQLIFMNGGWFDLDGAQCLVTRSGYSGEDGFEISVPSDQAEALARTLLGWDEVAAAGLGARDSLRLEAGLCLYGNDLDATTTPVEASLLWALSKVRRTGGAREGGFPGAEVILGQIAEGAERKRVGILPEGKAPVREGSELQNLEGQPVGTITSGCFGPTLGAPVAMGYVQTSYAKLGTELRAVVRGKPRAVKVAKTPFVPQRYYRG